MSGHQQGGCRKLHPDRIVDRIDDKDTKGRGSKTNDFMLTKTPKHVGNPEFCKMWNDWLRYAFGKKKVPYLTYVGQVDFLDAMPVDEAIESMGQSIRNGWRGLFPVRKGKAHTKPLTQKDHEQF
jgi:hypothetical protein